MGVWAAGMSVPHVGAWCPLRLEEGFLELEFWVVVSFHRDTWS